MLIYQNMELLPMKTKISCFILFFLHAMKNCKNIWSAYLQDILVSQYLLIFCYLHSILCTYGYYNTRQTFYLYVTELNFNSIYLILYFNTMKRSKNNLPPKGRRIFLTLLKRHEENMLLYFLSLCRDNALKPQQTSFKKLISNWTFFFF